MCLILKYTCVKVIFSRNPLFINPDSFRGKYFDINARVTMTVGLTLHQDLILPVRHLLPVERNVQNTVASLDLPNNRAHINIPDRSRRCSPAEVND